MQFYFIRHAQSANNLLYDTTGDSVGRSQDPELTPIGVRQAELLAEFLRAGKLNSINRANQPTFDAPFTHVYTSLMTRAAATGTAVARALNVPLVAWQDIHETGGIFLDDAVTGERIGQPGNNRAYFQTRFPDLVLPLTLGQAGWWNRPFEKIEDCPPRAERFLNDLIARHGDTEDRVAIVSHGGFYNLFLRAVFKIDRMDCWFSINNTAITRIDFHADGASLEYTNYFGFLPREMVT